MTDQDSEQRVEHVVARLEEALELQDSTEGEHCKTPTVEYCFECDEITVDGLPPEKCLYHPTVSSDGYEHAGINAAKTALECVGGDDA